MQAGALRALEFDRIVEVIRGFAETPPGADRLAELRPMVDPHRVAQALAATTEAVRFLSANPPFVFRAPLDLRAILDLLALHGRALEPRALLALADYLESVDRVQGSIRQRGSGFAQLRALAEAAAPFRGEVADVRRRIAPSGELVDQASAQLAAIRDRLRKQRSRLRGMLESYLRGRDTARYLQESVVTERNGRYVLVVKTEHRTSIPGIIHGASSSGASLFLEPLSTVEINNEVVALEEQEAQEIHRILLALSDAFRGRAADLHRTVGASAELDVLQAKARLAEHVRGVEPVLAADGQIELRQARHPLLIPAVAARLDQGEARSSEPVPIDLIVAPPTTALVISGPNTGGKTVALKTAGLLALMAQAGLHVPAADGSRLPVFRSVFVDIGDEQSIAANLSTYSWHVTNIAAMDRELVLPALVLLDEIGAGTDPVEGGALGVAIVDHFRKRGATVITTTHHDAVKAYASTTAGVMCAAFGFAPDTFVPTYRLTYGSPGRSLAIEIARRLGLNPAIVEAAGRNLTEREAQLADHLAKIDEDRRRLDHEGRLIAREREMLHEAESRQHAREEALRQREETYRRKLDERLDERLRDARVEIDGIIADLKRRTAERSARQSAEPLSTGDAGLLRVEARTAVEAALARQREEPAEPGPVSVTGPPATVGDRVSVGGLNLEGRVLSVHDDEAEIDIRGKRMRARLRELRVVERGAPAAPGHVSVSVQLQPRDEALGELNVIGCTVDEALTRADRFLDEALLGSERTLRVIHGYGTGQLRRALAGFFAKHPFVARFALAAPDQGGGGVTIVELKE